MAEPRVSIACAPNSIVRLSAEAEAPCAAYLQRAQDRAIRLVLWFYQLRRPGHRRDL